jgi:hypothetical protein
MVDFVQLPSDGSGKKVHTAVHNVEGDIVNTQVVHVGDRLNPLYRQAVDSKGAANVRYAEGEPNLDAFGGLKVSNAHTIAVYEHTCDSNDDLFTTEVSNGGSYTHSPGTASLLLTTNTNVASSAIRVSNRCHYYSPGSGQLFMLTVGLGDTGKANNVRNWGAATPNNGVFFNLVGTTLNFVVRSNTSGTPVETVIPQSTWNTDKLDGTGLSGIDVDLSKVYIYWIDYQWLGAGRVRFGVVGPDGSRIVAHTIQNSGNHSTVYMRQPHLPIRLENYNTGVVSGGSDLRFNCGAVKTEGFIEYSFWRFMHERSAAKVLTTSDLPVLSLRSAVTFNGAPNRCNAYPESLSMYVTGGPVKVTLYWPVTLVGDTWAIADNGSTLEADEEASSLTIDADTWIMRSFYLDSGALELELAEYFETVDEGILLAADGSAAPFTIAAKKLNGGDTVTMHCAVNYKELR